MNGRTRLQTVLDGKMPDKVPHFELVFQIPEQAFGMSWPTHEEYLKASMKEKEALDERWFVINEKIIETYGWCAICADLPRDQVKKARERFGNDAMIYAFNGQGTYWMPSGADFMDFTVALFENPKELHKNAKIKRNNAIERAKQLVDQGVDFICINSDFGFNQGPFISPKHFSEFVTPYFAEIIEATHDLGVKAILHSDGDLRLLLDQLFSTGLDGYQSIDPQGNMDIAKVKQQYGSDHILMGNVKASALQDTNDTLIRESVRYAMKHGKPGGNFIFSTSNCIYDGMPLENYHIMLDEYEKLAYYKGES